MNKTVAANSDLKKLKGEIILLHTVSSQNLEHFAQLVEQNRLAAKGAFPFVCYYLYPSAYLKNITATFVSQLDAFERQAIHLEGEGLAEQKRKVEAFIRAGDALLSKHSSVMLQQKLYALKYRVEGVNGGLDKKERIDPSIYNSLEHSLKEWKKKKAFYAKEQKPLCDRDFKVLQEICRYEEFAKLLQKNHNLRDVFFRWSIKDNNQAAIFVEFPSVCRRISSVLLSGRVGRFAGKILTLEKGEKKDLCLRFQVELSDKSLESRKFSILDESQTITVRGGGKWSIKDIFERVFAKKNLQIGDFEVFGGDNSVDTGIIPWNSHEHGYYSSRRAEYVRNDLSDPRWWEKLPVFEIITESELEKRTGLKLEGKEPWGVVMAKASRKFPNLDIDNCHGFLSIAVRQDAGRYRIYDMGKFAAKFPSSPLEHVSFLANTVLAKIEYPDTNNFYSDRQIATIGQVLNKEQGGKLMQLVAKDVQKARDNNLIFQFGWENCAYWPQKIFNEMFGHLADNFYRIPVIKSEISNFVLKFAVAVARRLPKKWQYKWVEGVLWLLGYERGIVVEENGKQVKKNLRHTPFIEGTHEEDRQNFYCPAYEHRLIEEGYPGVLAGGHH